MNKGNRRPHIAPTYLMKRLHAGFSTVKQSTLTGGCLMTSPYL